VSTAICVGGGNLGVGATGDDLRVGDDGDDLRGGGDSSALWRWRLQPAVGVNPIIKIEFSTMRAIQQEAVAFFL
jgi:hypothetical protein